MHFLQCCLAVSYFSFLFCILYKYILYIFHIYILHICSFFVFHIFLFLFLYLSDIGVCMVIFFSLLFNHVLVFIFLLFVFICHLCISICLLSIPVSGPCWSSSCNFVPSIYTPPCSRYQSLKKGKVYYNQQWFSAALVFKYMDWTNKIQPMYKLNVWSNHFIHNPIEIWNTFVYIVYIHSIYTHTNNVHILKKFTWMCSSKGKGIGEKGAGN